MIVDLLKPAAEEIGVAPPPEAMEIVTVMDLMADIFEEEGVKHIFGLTSGGT